MWGAMHAPLSDLCRPEARLVLQIVPSASVSATEEVLAYVPDAVLDLALGLRTVGPTQTRNKPPVASEVSEGGGEGDFAARLPPCVSALRTTVLGLSERISLGTPPRYSKVASCRRRKEGSFWSVAMSKNIARLYPRVLTKPLRFWRVPSWSVMSPRSPQSTWAC